MMARTPASENPAHYRSVVQEGLRIVTQDMLLKGFVWSICQVHVHGRERVDNVQDPFIVVANHSSHLDAALVLGALPHRLSRHIATGAAADYFFDKKLKAVTTSLFFNAYPIERHKSTTHKGLTGRLLDSGVPLLIFPEGTRSRTGAMGQFKPGVAGMAIERGIPCVPVALVGAFAAWPYTRHVPPVNHPTVHVVIGHPQTAVAGELPTQYTERLQRTVAELYNTTAKAYGMPTLDDYARAVALKQAELAVEQALANVEQSALLDDEQSADEPSHQGPDQTGRRQAARTRRSPRRRPGADHDQPADA
jgi:1-acyl-sn-glycerol-3-phosphate acyltransferase